MAPALVSPKWHLGLEESGGPQRAAPGGGVWGGKSGAAGQSRSQGLTPPPDTWETEAQTSRGRRALEGS